MSYHTFETSYRLTPTEWNTIKDKLYKSKGKVYIDCYDYLQPIVCETLKVHGIILKLIKYRKNEFDCYMLYYRINPRRVIESYNYIGIFDESDTDEMLDKTDKYLESVYKLMPSVYDCMLHRIDFCANITLSSQNEVEEYIKILQRGMYPKKYYPEMYYDLKSKRDKLYKNSITISHKNLLSVTYYNKYEQLKQNRYCKNIKDAKNILRAEIQCKKNKVKHLMGKFGCTDIHSFLTNSDKIGKYVFKEYANIFYGKGDFYKLDKIYEKIDNSKYKDKSKKMMKELVKLSAKHSSLETAMNELELKQKERRAVMERFDKIGVSPMVIPRRFEHDRFKNPLTLALKYGKFR